MANTSASKTDNLTQEPEIVASHIASSIALFAPQHTNDGIRLYQRIGQDARLILKRVVTSPDPQDISVIRLVQGLTHTEYGSGNIVLFTGDTVNRAPEVVMGAYFPGITTIDHSTGVEQDRKEFRATIPPVLFQLLPIFCLLRLTKGDLTLAEVIKSEDSDIHLDEILSMAEGAKSSQAAYQISSAMNDMGATLRVDPEKRTVELSGDNGHRYRDLKENRNTSLNCERKPVIQNARMDLLTVVEAEV